MFDACLATWANDIRSSQVVNLDSEKAIEGLKEIRKYWRLNQLTKISSIDRAWREVQNQCEDLRGASYYENRSIKEPEARQNAIEFKKEQKQLKFI